jgi:hypothetical protein
MIRAALLAAATALCLAACSSDSGERTIDQFGNVYPPECRGDLSHVAATIQAVTPDALQFWAAALHKPANWRLYGLTVGRKSILVDETIAGWKRDDLVHHERCHIIAGEWHR